MQVFFNSILIFYKFKIIYILIRYKTGLKDQIDKTEQLIELLQQDQSIYYAHKELSDLKDDVEVNENEETRLQKSGYLNLKS